ncbi:hypothetical protein [Allorhodopirellula heiligendammensis]|nr:hypothetical protein [Allorhodopirellula heiligendammensis]
MDSSGTPPRLDFLLFVPFVEEERRFATPGGSCRIGMRANVLSEAEVWGL